MNINTVKGISLGMIATIFWGGFYPISRLLFGFDEDSVDALNFSVLRFALAALCLSPLFFRKCNRMKASELWHKHWKLLLSLGLIGIVGEGLFVFWALKYTTSARASLMANASPITTLLISYFAGKELLTRNKVVGMIIGFLGLVLVFMENGEDSYTTGASTLIGDAMAFFSGVCWAYFTVFGGEIAKHYGGLLCSELMFIAGLCFMLPMALIKNGGIRLDLPWQVWLGAIYLGGLSYGLANSLWYMALKYVTPGELGSLGYVSAMLAAVCSWLFLGEHFSGYFLLAIVCVMGGVALMLSRSRNDDSGKASAEGKNDCSEDAETMERMREIRTSEEGR